MDVKNIVQNYDDIAWVYLGLKDKQYFIDPPEDMSEGYDPTERPWYQAAVRKKGQVIINDPYIDDTTSQMITTLSKTVENDGELLGVLGIDMNMDKLFQHISSIDVGKKGSVCVLSPEGNILLHSDKTKIGQSIKDEGWFSKLKGQEGVFEHQTKGRDLICYYNSTSQGFAVVLLEDKAEVFADVQRMIWMIIALCSIVVIFALIVAILIGKNYFVKPIHTISRTITELGEDNLTAESIWDSKDEFGLMAASLNNTTKNLKLLIQELIQNSRFMKDKSENLQSSAFQIKKIEDYADKINQEIEGMAAIIEETSAGVHEIAVTSEHVASSVQELTIDANDASEVAQLGKESVQTIVEDMQMMAEETIRTSQIADKVAGDVQNIEEILNVINGIAAQTNLLALNASIEAARAGEGGKGFAVVAQEIRSLAEESKTATEKIADTLTNIKVGSEQAGKATEKAEQNVMEMNQDVQRLSEHFQKIV
jgi:methyl-accepting chemotaxis protein